MGRKPGEVSRWWRVGLAVVLAGGMGGLVFLSARAYRDAPPIPARVVGPGGETVFTREDVLEGQAVFLRRGLMENGSIWGHGGYLGPDFAAEYLHRLVLHARSEAARRLYGREFDVLGPVERRAAEAEVRASLKANRFDARTEELAFTAAEAESYNRQVGGWAEHFESPHRSGGLPAGYVSDAGELRALVSFFAWAAWASVANRPGVEHSYTNNFPYDPDAGNTPTADTVLWSMLSILMLLGGTALVLFAFGRFDFLGWKGQGEAARPVMVPGEAGPGQKAAVKFFVVVAALFLAQTLIGGGIAHFRAEPGSFYGFDLSRYLPSHLLRSWHLQLAIFWVATAYVGGGLFLAPSLGRTESAVRARWVHVLFWALVAVVAGSLVGQLLGLHQLLGRLWYWFGHQGWEYLDLGRAWQLLLAGGLVLWLWLLWIDVSPGWRDPEQRELSVLFLAAAASIPLFYLPAFFFGAGSNYAVVEMWRFWIIHLWVEGFFEIFVTVMVALVFLQLGLVARATAIRVIYLDAILFLSGGIIGTAHHWYWTGQSSVAMAFAAMYSALEVVPLTLLTLDAGDFLKLGATPCEVCGKRAGNPHRWAFYFLIATGFWNFVGAGVFGFLINLPIVSYFEAGTMLTPNHGHAAFMGAFGMLAIALLVLALRQVSTDEQWRVPERFVRLSFYGLNLGLAGMLASNLFPGGVLQLRDVLQNGYWHARALAYLDQAFVRRIEWLRMPADLVFIGLGAVPLLVAALLVYRNVLLAGRCR